MVGMEEKGGEKGRKGAKGGDRRSKSIFSLHTITFPQPVVALVTQRQYGSEDGIQVCPGDGGENL